VYNLKEMFYYNFFNKFHKDFPNKKKLILKIGGIDE